MVNEINNRGSFHISLFIYVCRTIHTLPAAPLFKSADRVKAAGISCVVVGEALIREEDPAKAAEALLL